MRFHCSIAGFVALALIALFGGGAIAQTNDRSSGVHDKRDQELQVARLRREGVLKEYDKSKSISARTKQPRALVLRDLITKKSKTKVSTGLGTPVGTTATLLLSQSELANFVQNVRLMFTDVKPAKRGRVWHPQIISGVDPYPHTVFLSGNGRVCTGTLISPRHVITAAHCFCDRTFNVIAGRSAIQIVAASSANATRSVSHIACDLLNTEERVGQNIYKGDVALLSLNYPINGIAKTRIATEEMLRASSEFIAVGFGRTNYGDPGTKFVTPKMAFTSHDCTEPQSGVRCEPGLEMKGGGVNGDTCEGDSGGPAFIRGPNQRLYLAGVTSRSVTGDSTCGRGGIYVKLTVPKIREWLISKGLPSNVFQ